MSELFPKLRKDEEASLRRHIGAEGKQTTTHLVGTTFPSALYGSLTTQKNWELHLFNEPYVDSNPKKSDPNCIVVYRGENKEHRIGCLPRDSEAQKYAKELLDKGKGLTALVTNIKYGTATSPEMAQAIKNVQEFNEKADFNAVSKMVQSSKTDTSYNEAVDKDGVFTFPVMIEVSFGEKDANAGHLEWEANPDTDTLCRSVTQFLGDPATEQLYLTPSEIEETKNFDDLMGAQKNIMLATCAIEGSAYHALAGLLAYLWWSHPEKEQLDLHGWETQTEWNKLLCEMPTMENSIIYPEDRNEGENKVFNDAMKLKGTADLFYFMKDESKIILYDFKRGGLTDPKTGKVKREALNKKYVLQSAFYATELAKKYECAEYEANIVYMNISKDLTEPFEIKRMDKEYVDRIYSNLQRIVLKEKIV